MATCIYCALYDSKPVLSKNGRIMRNRVGRCLWLSTEPWRWNLMKAKAAYASSPSPPPETDNAWE